FEWEGRVLHAKTATVDHRWSTIGSSNLDRQSLRFNLEVNVIVEDPAFAGAMEGMFFHDLTSCREITLDTWEKRSLWERGASWAPSLARDWLWAQGLTRSSTRRSGGRRARRARRPRSGLASSGPRRSTPNSPAPEPRSRRNRRRSRSTPAYSGRL